MLTYNQVQSRAKVLARLLLESEKVLKVGIFGSQTLGKFERPVVGDIDLLIMVTDGVKISDPPIYYPDEEATLGIKMLAELSVPNELDVFDKVIALVTSWETKVDIAVFPESPTSEFLERFYWRTAWGLLRHIAIATRIFDPKENVFKPNMFQWAGYAASIRHMRDFAFNDGWGDKIEEWEY